MTCCGTDAQRRVGELSPSGTGGTLGRVGNMMQHGIDYTGVASVRCLLQCDIPLHGVKATTGS